MHDSQIKKKTSKTIALFIKNSKKILNHNMIIIFHPNKLSLKNHSHALNNNFSIEYNVKLWSECNQIGCKEDQFISII